MTREQVQADAVRAIRDNDFTGLFVIAPRVGKTKIAIQAIGKEWGEWKDNIQIVTPREEINNIWKTELIKWDFILQSEYGYKPFEISPLCFPSIKKIPEGLELLVVDEPQMLSLNQLDWIVRKKPKRLLLVTGTANKYTRGKILYKLGLESRFEYPIEEAIKDGIISNFHVYIVRVPMDDKDKVGWMTIAGERAKVTEKQHYDFYTALFDIERIKEKLNPEHGRWKDLASRRRAAWIYTGKSKIRIAKMIQEHINERVIVFTARTDVADELSPYSHHSKNKKKGNLKRFIEGEINTLSVVQMSDMGITIPNLKYEVVHQLQSNSETSLQKFLRTCNLEEDKEAKIIITVYKDTVDEGWARQATEGVPESKISWVELEDLGRLLEKLG